MQSYRRYYGRRNSHFGGFLKAVLILILVLILLFFAVSLFLQRYLVYEDDGVRLDLPWNESEPEQSSPAPSVSVSPPPLIKEEEPSGTQSTPEPDPDLPDPIPLLHAVQVDPSALKAGTVQTAAAAAGADGVILTMKEDDGDLNFVFSHPLAMRIGSSAADPTVNEAIRELTAGDLYTVAQVSCFRDHRASSVASEHKISTASGYCWEDHESLRWISPAAQDARDYLTDLCVALAELGFDEILLTNCGYPSAEQGNLERIRKDEAYPADALDTVIAPFLQQMRTALAPYEVKLSVRAQLPELTGETAYTGLTLQNILAGCDRVWLPEADRENASRTLWDAGSELDLSRFLVSVRTEAGDETSSWAILN